jgi:hypothetical protein
MNNDLFHGGNFSGPLDPLFLFADGYRLSDIPERKPLCEATRHRLVKAAKSPTEAEIEDLAHKKAMFFHNSMVGRHCDPGWKRGVMKEYERGRIKTPKNQRGCQTVIEFREWQEAWRIRTEVDCTTGTVPPSQSGLRESEMLTARGATKIAESCEYMHMKHGGFKTFVTGTFREDIRAKIAAGETSIQREITRTMDAMQKMFQRGWTTSTGERVAGHGAGLPYLWVVEVPDNSEGEPNPHVHMLLGWAVPFRLFKEWSTRIESLWGNGYFHLEKIKDSSCAGAYMAKAAGYLCKAQDKDTQGVVKGNRYGISATARAPAWVAISRAQIHTMGQLIYDIYDHLTVKYGDKYRERKLLNAKLAETPKAKKDLRQKIGKRLARVRQELNAIPVRCNKYQLVVKGKAAALSLFSWLVVPTEDGAVKEEWLPEKPEGWHWIPGEKPKAEHGKYFSLLYAKFERQRFWRRLNPPEWISETANDDWWHANRVDYEMEASCEPVPAYLDFVA